MRRLGPVLLTGLLLAAACSASDLTLDQEVVGDGDRDASEREDAGVDVDADPDEVVEVALEDVESYWTEQLPEVYGIDLDPLAGGFMPYGPDTEVPQCGPSPLQYDDIAANALYCPEGDFIAWDRVNLIPGLQEDFGPLTVGIVMAHEYAHAIQTRGDVVGAAVTIELQADCFAGAWVADASDRLPLFRIDGESLDQAVGGFLELRDTVGVAAGDPRAHGSGFDRVSAFQDGFDRGTERCADYEDDPPEVVALPFRTSDFATGGNLPIDDLIEPLLADLESFYRALLNRQGSTWEPLEGISPVDPEVDQVTCGQQTLSGPDLELASFYCVPDNTIYIDNTELVPALDGIGDFAVGGEIARQYAFAAQHQLGILDRHDSTGLHADCLTGVYASAQFFETIPDQRLLLSAGDLDEIIVAFLAFGSDVDASAFERTAAFRTGFVSSYDRCEQFLR